MPMMCAVCVKFSATTLVLGIKAIYRGAAERWG